MRKEIIIPNVDIGQLRKQRDHLLQLLNIRDYQVEYDNDSIDAYKALMDVIREEEIDGLINMLDTMLDIAEGYTIKKPN